MTRRTNNRNGLSRWYKKQPITIRGAVVAGLFTLVATIITVFATLVSQPDIIIVAPTSAPETSLPVAATTGSSAPGVSTGNAISGSAISTVDPAAPPANPALGELWVRPTDGAEMVYVPGGTFVMGDTDLDAEAAFERCEEIYGACRFLWFVDEYPKHSVTLDGFWIDKYEIDNNRYAAFLNQAGAAPEDVLFWLSYQDPDVLIEIADGAFTADPDFATHPVVEVSWYGADAYCSWASGQLPTEAQWAYAARGSNGNVFPWGNVFDGTLLNFCDVNCVAGGGDRTSNDNYRQTAPTGRYPGGRSWVGALDLAGNVWEWTADWHGPYSAAAEQNPTGPERGETKVIRGGSWSTIPPVIRATTRDRFTPDYHFSDVGFRCALDE